MAADRPVICEGSPAISAAESAVVRPFTSKDHMHMLAIQLKPLAHAIPQFPQFAGSDVGSTHTPPHSFVLPRQLTPHLPPEQT